MSRSSILNRYFEDAERFLRTLDILNDPEKIYNIDESWYCEKAEKLKKVVTTANCKIPYKVYGGRQSHTTLTMCISASGKWLPVMITFQGTIPKTEVVHDAGPKDALYSSSDSGHIDTELYTQYIKHIKPFLCKRRPVAIFQDNLSSHESLELVEFCVEKNIHLYNLPSKSSHLVQPLDKLFGLLKQKIEDVKHETVIVQQKNTNRSQVPLLVRFAMNRISQFTIRESFRDTGLCPLDSSAISKALLVSPQDMQESQANHAESQANHAESAANHVTSGLSLQVFDDNGNNLDPEVISDNMNCAQTQTNPIESLPCSVCIANDVRLHPAVSSGAVDLDLASVLIPDKATASTSQSGIPKRDNSKRNGRWLTHETEIQRMREKKEALIRKAELKKNKEEMRKKRKIESENRKKEQAVIRKQENQRKREEKKAIRNASKGIINDSETCVTCKKKPEKDTIVACILCEKQYHKSCAQPRIESFVTVCGECHMK